MRNKKVLVLVLALSLLNMSCSGAPATAPEQDEPEKTARPTSIPSTPTDYIPPTTTSIAPRPSATAYVPPTVSATAYVPPTVPASPPPDSSSQSPIDQKYRNLGGPGSFLGQP